VDTPGDSRLSGSMHKEIKYADAVLFVLDGSEVMRDMPDAAKYTLTLDLGDVWLV